MFLYGCGDIVIVDVVSSNSSNKVAKLRKLIFAELFLWGLDFFYTFVVGLKTAANVI